VNVKTLPSPGAPVHQMLPPRRSTMSWTAAGPTPGIELRRAVEVRKNGLRGNPGSRACRPGRALDGAQFLSDLDRMAFTTAVIDNVIRHTQPDAGAELQLGVDVTVSAERLEARISEIGARRSDPAAGDAAMPEAGAENGPGWGLALIQALVTTVTFEREDGTNVWVLRRNASNAPG
jgi:serine/threonine-protein kinase RsbW